jgi:hypothetical protein
VGLGGRQWPVWGICPLGRAAGGYFRWVGARMEWSGMGEWKERGERDGRVGGSGEGVGWDVNGEERGLKSLYISGRAASPGAWRLGYLAFAVYSPVGRDCGSVALRLGTGTGTGPWAICDLN